MSLCQPDCTVPDIETIQHLNQVCDCVSMQPVIDRLWKSSESLPVDIVDLLQDRVNLFADTAVFISQAEVQSIRAQISAIEAVCLLPQYREMILHRQNALKRYSQASGYGVLMGYDFHLTPQGPRLIEVNTNAGGAFIMQLLLSKVIRSVSPCASESLDSPADVEQRLVSMLLDEWRQCGRSGQPETIAIVDTSPQSQYLYPDMRLAQLLFERNGLHAIIVEPTDLRIRNGKLLCGEQQIDFVYNRTTDFSLTDPESRVLEDALINDIAVISPGPVQHAFYADKQNPLIWKNSLLLNQWSVNKDHIDVLACLPDTELVSSDNAGEFWSRRKKLFFKPNDGFGSRAVYRGNKVTRKVWGSIESGGYVAQTLVPPSTRYVEVSGSDMQMKFDVRIYTYRGRWLLGGARVYQGQTTNFRTPGGGFAPLVYLA